MDKVLNEKYPIGTRLKLIKMKDREYPLDSGIVGTVLFVDNNKMIHMHWDNNKITPLDLEEDEFEVIYITPKEKINSMRKKNKF